MIVIDPNPPLLDSRSIYIPIVQTVNRLQECFRNRLATTMFELIRDDYRQKRTVLHCKRELCEVAEYHTEYMVKTDNFSHVVNGVTINELLRKKGLVLPEYYSMIGNNTESIAGGSESPYAIFNALMDSANHSIHLAGLNDFFVAQKYCGIAVSVGGSVGWYWSIIITDLVTSGE